MADAVAAAYPKLSHRYYALKARALGKARLDQWDRNAPLETTAPRGFDWNQGRELVLESFNDLGGEFAERAGRALPMRTCARVMSLRANVCTEVASALCEGI
jgi:oligoendopeptidase F